MNTWWPDREPVLGIVLAPGRLGDARSLAWLARPLTEAGAAVAPVSYPDGGRYLSDDADEAAAMRDRLLAELPPGVPCVAAGHSRGATVSLLTAAWHHGWDAVVALSPTTDQERLVRGLERFAPSRHRLMIAARGAAPDEDPEYYRLTSPVLQARCLHVPVLLVHGTLDLVIPHDHSLWLRDALHQAGHRRVDLALLEGVGHFFERMYGGYVFDEVGDTVIGWLRRRELLPVAPGGAAEAAEPALGEGR